MRITRDSPFRSIKPSLMTRLCTMIDVGAKYKTLAEDIVKRNGEPLFDNEEINNFLDLELMKPNGSPTKSVFQRWSYINPTIGDVIDKLYAVELKRPADFIRTEVLKETLDEAVVIEDTSTTITSETTEGSRFPVVNTDDETSSGCIEILEGMCLAYKYADLEACTGHFSQSRKVGSGGSCHVYKGLSEGLAFAVKIFKDIKPESINSYKKQFETEIRALSGLRHENILNLYGYSIDGANACIVYEFMPRGSLEDLLSCTGSQPPLSIHERVSILKGTADGICFIHSKNLIHRDIKSANVLLTESLVPKIGDFGTLREGPKHTNQTHTHTDIVQGTYGYMAPEYYESVVSQGLDCYAFGVIVMECLTGMPCYNPNREDKYLVSYIKENIDAEHEIVQLVDTKAGSWPYNLSVQMYRLSVKTWSARKHRPCMPLVLEEMQRWSPE